MLTLVEQFQRRVLNNPKDLRRDGQKGGLQEEHEEHWEAVL